ncbi:ribonuclease HII [Mesonia sp. HuA40]|uniref:ribonuclease HII n=1 Tax=Mesonia sp. HuA40 TaxID=2602761 RepID=UPI0011C74861|nr:ribonuclease HII [Mesonia sp. HuA40]TXK74607.1 ribonuclease HII [Mesonia sp. HuA40]
MLPLQYSTHNYECGTDEAGRGCLAGPVTAAAVILPPNFKHSFLTDSKKLTPAQRENLCPIIKQEALAFAIVHVSEQEIDEINILQASLLAMRRAIEQLNIKPDFIAVDGNKFTPINGIPHQCIVKGDAKFLNIAAASILAKTARDQYMLQIHEQAPVYNWAKNKGYPTAEHRAAIRTHGISAYHRKSFRLLPEQYTLAL